MWEKYNAKWFMCDEAIEHIISIFKKEKYTTILEYGTNVGYLASKLSETFEVTSIERDERFFKEAKKNCPNTTLYQGEIEAISPNLNEFDVVILDAEKSLYIKHFELALNHSPKMIIADNVISHKKKLITFLKHIEPYNPEIITVGDGLAIIHLEHSQNHSLNK